MISISFLLLFIFWALVPPSHPSSLPTLLSALPKVDLIHEISQTRNCCTWLVVPVGPWSSEASPELYPKHVHMQGGEPARRITPSLKDTSDRRLWISPNLIRNPSSGQLAYTVERNSNYGPHAMPKKMAKPIKLIPPIQSHYQESAPRINLTWPYKVTNLDTSSS